jgi:NADPH-dependent curcumin reductase CurA
VVSAAAGAVGSVAGQLAKAAGARVVGIAGGPQKCALLTDELGFDAAVDHRADDWAAQLKAATPDGIDVDFENVGGALMDAIFARLNIGARVALCGLISSTTPRTRRPARAPSATCSSSARWSRASSSSTTSARRRRRSPRSPA